jgi:branched-subunit amino acid transport protein
VTVLLACAGATAATWVLRVLFIAVVPARSLPATVRGALPSVGPAVLAAVVAAALFGTPAHGNAAVLAGAVATGLVVWRSGSVVLATGIGLCAVAAIHLL